MLREWFRSVSANRADAPGSSLPARRNEDFTPAVLPFHFDTTTIWRHILTAVFGFEAVVIVPGVLYLALGRQSAIDALVLGISGALLLGFTARAFPAMRSSIGVLDENEIVVRRGSVLGLRLPGPEGRFTIDRFRAIRVEEASGPIPPVQGGPNERVYLAGLEGTPDILIARTQRRTGYEFAEDLGFKLGLPAERIDVAY